MPIAGFIEENVYPHLDLLPSHPSFCDFDIKLEDDERNSPLKTILGPLSEDTSLVILDCSPGQSRLTEHVLKDAAAETLSRSLEDNRTRNEQTAVKLTTWKGVRKTAEVTLGGVDTRQLSSKTMAVPPDKSE